MRNLTLYLVNNWLSIIMITFVLVIFLFFSFSFFCKKLGYEESYVYFVYSRARLNLTTQLQIDMHNIKLFLSYGPLAWISFYPLVIATIIIVICQFMLTILFAINYFRLIVSACIFKLPLELQIKDITVNLNKYVFRTAFYHLFFSIPKAQGFIFAYNITKLLVISISKLQYKYKLGTPIYPIKDVYFGPHSEEHLLKDLEEAILISLFKLNALFLFFIFLFFKLPFGIITGISYYSTMQTIKFIRRAVAQKLAYDKQGLYAYFIQVITAGIILSTPTHLNVEYLKISSVFVQLDEFGHTIYFEDPRTFKYEEHVAYSTNSTEVDGSTASLNDRISSQIHSAYDSLFEGTVDENSTEYQLATQIAFQEEMYENALWEFNKANPFYYRLKFNPIYKMYKMYNRIPALNNDIISQNKWINDSKNDVNCGWITSTNNPSGPRHLGVFCEVGFSNVYKENLYITVNSTTKPFLWSTLTKNKEEAAIIRKNAISNLTYSKLERNVLSFNKNYSGNNKLQFITKPIVISKENITYENVPYITSQQKLNVFITCYRYMLYNSLLANKATLVHLSGINTTSNSIYIKNNDLGSIIKDSTGSGLALKSDLLTMENILLEHKLSLNTKEGILTHKLTVLERMTANGAQLYISNNYNNIQYLTHTDILKLQNKILSTSDIEVIENAYRLLFV